MPHELRVREAPTEERDDRKERLDLRRELRHASFTSNSQRTPRRWR